MPSICTGKLIFRNSIHASALYVRKTKTKTKTAAHGEDSFTYRIVESVHEGAQVKQLTLRNLDKDFIIEPAVWPLLAARIEQLLQGSALSQAELFSLSDEVPQLLVAATERYRDLIIAKLAQLVAQRHLSKIIIVSTLILSHVLLRGLFLGRN